MKVKSLYTLATLLAIFSLLLCSCAVPGVTPTATNIPPTPTEIPKPTLTATLTSTPTKTPQPTPTPNLKATQAYEDFFTKVQKYYDAKYISTTAGTYTHLYDNTYTWAKLNYYQWYETGFSPSDFVLKSDITWDSASAAANSSGCGFVFHEQENNDNYMFFISLKGFLRMSYLLHAKGNYSNIIGHGTYGLPAQSGSAQITLIAEGNTFRALVNDKLIKVFTGLQGKLTTGGLAYTVFSGTNKGFGTKCSFKNTELWTIQHQ
jgi:hypothetical protein